MARSRRNVTLTVVAAVCTLGTGAASRPWTSPDEGRSVTLTGKVVDAACYMIHPPAASIPSHQDCGAACLARGVPLAIANESDGVLYFPADGNKRLVPLLDQRVRVAGSVTRKSEPMELKMAVGDSNQMVVRVDGGYHVVTISSLEKVSSKATR